MTLSRLVVVLAGLIVMAFAVPGVARADAPERCWALAGDGFAATLDAPTYVTKATYVAATEGRPAYCDIEGYVSPNVGFGMWLPAENWNGKFIARGCGGFCGIVNTEFSCSRHLVDGYACIQNDMGHKSTLVDGAWAYNNTQAEIDFGYRATHVSTLAGKAITEAFYQTAARYSYFMGCSTGGRQAMVEAQRFPDDFDGIVAVAPVINETGAGIQLLWSVLANRDAAGNEILTQAVIPALHRAAVEACDMTDGLKDGIIGDPRLCRFDPAVIACEDAAGPECLTAAQIEAAKKIYEGPRDSSGRALYTGGAQPGSEMAWVGAYVAKDGVPASYGRMQTELWRYMSFSPDPGPSWTAEDFDFDRDPARTGMMEAIYSGSNPDLRGFQASGGKLLIAQGWTDQSVVPLNIVDYYETMTRTMGGPAATNAFARLFMMPGTVHCTGGEGAYGVDYLEVLEVWVERGEAPDRLVGINPVNPADVDWMGMDVGQLTPDQIRFSRPHFAYPNRAVYRGRGDVNAAESFVSRAP